MLSVFVRQWRSLPKIFDTRIFGKTTLSHQTSGHGLSRRTGWLAGCHLGLASLLLLMGSGSVHDAAASNETRTLSFHHTHSGEDVTITFKRDGRYDEDALKQLNHYLRDWRSQDETVMDRHLFDILWEVYRDVDGKQPIQIVSAYRSPGTNAMLRRRSAHTGVARHSQHMLGHAMDFYIPGVPLEQIRFAGLRLQRGGVGFYPTSGSPFVHLDTGNIRHWPRMTHDQLVRVFPDGRTVHIPSDGVPLKGYELARADIEKRGDGDTTATASAPSLLARLFRGKPAEDDDESATEGDAKFTEARFTEAKFTQVASAAPARPTDRRALDKASDKASAVRSKLASALQLASADTQLVQPAKPKQSPDTAAAPGRSPQSVADIINARGFWGDNSTALKQATPEQVAAITARRAATSDPQSTGSTSVMNAMAFAPLASPGDRTNVAAGAAPVSTQSRSSSRNTSASTDAGNDAAMEPQTRHGLVADAARISAVKVTDTSWMRVMMLAPSASRGMSVTVLGDSDLSVMRSYFVKPQSTLALGFSEDATPGLTYDQFTGAAAVKLETRSFAVRAAAPR